MKRFPARRKSRPKILALVLLGLVLFSIFRLFGAWNNRVWLGDSRLSFAMATTPPVLASYEPETGILTLVTFPPRLEVSAAFGFGEFSSEKLWDLGIQKGLSGAVLAKTFEKELGVPVDGWVDALGLSLLGGEVGVSRSFVWFVEGLQGIGSFSNFTIFDKIRILVEIGRIPAGRRQILDSVKLGISQPVMLADGLAGYQISQSLAQATLAQKLSDVKVVRENLTVSVVNTTDVSGAATKVARIINTLGARIVAVGSKESKLATCQVNVSSRARESMTARRILAIFGCTRGSVEPGAGEIEIILGEEVAQQLAD